MSTKKKNFYAVRSGNVPGIYFTWSDCKKQVIGVKGAVFKGFEYIEDALAFLGRQAPSPEDILSAKMSSKKRNNLQRKIEHHSKEARFSPDYIAYTDGSCLVNPGGAGGWAAVITNTKTNQVAELFGGSPNTTNNRMELLAAIMAMSYPDKPSKIALYTDSQYLQHAFTKKWLVNWKRRGWKKSNGEAILNQDLWEKLDELYQKHQVEFFWVRGHVGIEQNERCDSLARKQAILYQKS